MTEQKNELTVIVPVTERYDDTRELYLEYKQGLQPANVPLHFIYVLDGAYPAVYQALIELKQQGEPITIIKLAKWFGEATVLNIALDYAKSDCIMTLPAYHQVDSTELPRLFSQLQKKDLIVARRHPRIDTGFNRLQNNLFHYVLRLLTGQTYHDLGCGVRVMRRRVLEELHMYGDQHRFLPLLAFQKGFKIEEIPVQQSKRDVRTRVYRPGVYMRRLLDLLTIFFLVKFTKKPLRFFGLMGSAIFTLGVIGLLYVIVERLFFDVAMADRPAMLLSSLFIVLGIQIFAIGLIGEIVIFTHAKELKEYTIEEIVN